MATESSPFNPISRFKWMARNCDTIIGANCFSTNIVHPGVTYFKDGGALSRFVPKDGRIEVWGTLDTRWPVVHRDDLASAYRLIVEDGSPGESYNVCSEQGVRIGDIATAIAKRYSLTQELLVRSHAEFIAEHGPSSEGPTLDQQMGSEKIRSHLGWIPVHKDVVAEQH